MYQEVFIGEKLFTLTDEFVVVKYMSDEYIVVEYNGRLYERHKSVIGKNLFREYLNVDKITQDKARLDELQEIGVASCIKADMNIDNKENIRCDDTVESKEMNILIQNYKYAEKLFTNHLILELYGYWYKSYRYSAVAMHNSLGYKIIQNSVGFPKIAINKVIDVLTENQINFVIIEKNKVVLKKSFINNQFSVFLEESIYPICEKLDGNIVKLNDTVIVLDIDNQEKNEYQIFRPKTKAVYRGYGNAYYGAKVEFELADEELKEKQIAYDSPIGSALLGKNVGDIVSIKLPLGNIIKMEILEIY